MIRFACTCGEHLEVPDELGGTSIQCPKCGLLTDVPTLAEQQQFTDEGLYKFDTPAKPIEDDPDRMIELEIIYSKDKRDAEGHEIDLRTLPAGKRPTPPPARDVVDEASDDDDDDDDSTGELDLRPKDKEYEEVISRPKYDPETGELIRPLDVKKDPEKDVDPTTIPVAKAALSYAGGDVTKPVSPLKAVVELLMPMNLVVMAIVFVTHVFGAMMFTVGFQLLCYIVPAWVILQLLVLSHYGNVIDEIGRNERDELPRPLRDLSWYDDIWSPLCGMFAAILLSFVLPILILEQLGAQAGLPRHALIALSLAGMVIGTVIGPAIMLTTNTSGSIFNLRPDRLLHVVRICGWHYLVVMLLWTATWPIYMLGWLGFCLSLRDVFDISGFVAMPRGSLFLTGPALLAGIFLMHWFCWYLGLLYRAHHTQFPWILQRHVRDPGKKRVNHAEMLMRRRRAVSGHLVIPPSGPPPATPPPPSASRLG